MTQFINGYSVVPISFQDISGSLVFIPPGVTQSLFDLTGSDQIDFINASGSILLGTTNNDFNIDIVPTSQTAFYISASSPDPLVGLGTTNPLTNLDIRSTTGSSPANLILRTNEDGTITAGEETGRIIFAIESASYNFGNGFNFVSSGSTAAIFSKVIGTHPINGAYGSLVFEVNDDTDVTEPIEAMTIGYGLGPSNDEVGFILSGSVEIGANANQFRIVSTINGNELARIGFQAGEGTPYDRALFTLNDDGTNNVRLNVYNGTDFINTGNNLAIGTTTAPEKLTVQGNISASGGISASEYHGDGSNLTGVEAFPYTGSAEISGSLTVRDADTTLRGNLNVKGENTDASIINLGGNVNSGGSTKIIFKHHSNSTNEAAGILSSGTSYGRSTGLLFYVRSAFSDGGTLLSTDKILTLGAGGATFHKDVEFNNLELSYSDSSGGRLGMPLDMPSPTRSTLTLEGGQATYQNRGGGSLILKAGGGSGTGDSGIISFYTVTGSLASGEENTVLERARFTANGEFGIGTTSPQAKLHVEGNISSSGDIIGNINGGSF